MLKWTLSEWKNINREWIVHPNECVCVINREWASLFITHTLTHWGAWVREEKLSQCERENKLWRSSVLFWVLLLPLVLILSLRKLRGFILYGFPKENYLCLLSLFFYISMHVILLVKDPKMIMVAWRWKNKMVSEISWEEDIVQL